MIFSLKKDRNNLHLLVVEVEMVSMGLRSLLMVEKSVLGLLEPDLDDGGVVRGASRVEGIFILLLVE